MGIQATPVPAEMVGRREEAARREHYEMLLERPEEWLKRREQLWRELEHRRAEARAQDCRPDEHNAGALYPNWVVSVLPGGLGIDPGIMAGRDRFPIKTHREKLFECRGGQCCMVGTVVHRWGVPIEYRTRDGELAELPEWYEIRVRHEGLYGLLAPRGVFGLP